MKKICSWMGVFAAAAMTLAGCAEEIDQPKFEEGVPFELVANVATKTVNDGLSTNWDNDDALNVFYAEAGSEVYGTNCPFTVADAEAGLFKGTLSAALDASKAYDWYVLYSDGKPEYIKSPASKDSNGGYTYIGDSRGQLQAEYGSKSHLVGSSCPLYGVVKNLDADEQLSVYMNQLAAVIELKVTNATDAPLTIKSATIKAPGTALLGSFYFDLTTSPVTYTPVSGKTFDYAKVTVENPAELAKGESAALYFVVNPLTLAAGDKWSIQINNTEPVEKELTSALTFKAGEIFTVNYNAALIETDEPVTAAKSLPWAEDFSGDISQYTLVNGGSITKVYESDNLAGGTAPELLVSKNNGSFSAMIATDGYVGKLTLTFKSNYPERLTISSPTSGIAVSKESNTEYVINITESVDDFELVFKNTNSSNARLDDIFLVKGAQQSQTLIFEQSAFSFYIGSDEASAFTGQLVQGAKTTVTYSSSNENVAVVNPETGAVTLKDVEGSATITAVAEATEEYKEARASYLIALNKQSQGGVAKQYTFTITKADFNSTSYAANNNEKTSIATAADGSTMEVKWTSYQVMNQNSTMQWQKSKGYIYNTTDLGTIDDVTITTESGTFTKYINSSLQPTSNGKGGYFQIKVGSSTGKVTSIEVTFTQ